MSHNEKSRTFSKSMKLSKIQSGWVTTGISAHNLAIFPLYTILDLPGCFGFSIVCVNMVIGFLLDSLALLTVVLKNTKIPDA